MIEPVVSNLVVKLCQTLTDENIDYCHWKSNNALDRSASGDNDLDLLVSREIITEFSELLLRLGFKQAKAPVRKQLLGILDYYGYDGEADKLIHVQAHVQLILGHDMTKNYRLPIEKPYLESAVQGHLFKVPTPDFEFIVFILRMVLKHSTWDAILGREGTLKLSERQEQAYLQAHINQDRVHEILKQHLPYIGVELFHRCIQALDPVCSTWTRVKTGLQLQSKLQANSRRSLLVDTCLKLWRRGVMAIHRRIFKSIPKYRLESGGIMIALVGGDGAGKSTAIDSLYTWLSKHFDTTTVHMGKPSWSWTTIWIRSILKIGQLIGLYPLEASFDETIRQTSLVSPGYPWLGREVCTARDRYHVYLKARRFAANGVLVICDRFPLPQIKLMDGPRTSRFISELMGGPLGERFLSPHPNCPFTKALVKLEISYYQQIVIPELLIVLRIQPEAAVRRKTSEDAPSVYRRSKEIWKIHWERTEAHVIDARQSKEDVLSELKTLIWSKL